MRFPIRSQILLPMSVVMLLAVLGSSAISVWLARRSARARIQKRIDGVTRILERSTFPLTDQVLSQMSGLTGADFVLLDESGQVIGASDSSLLVDRIATSNVEVAVGLGEMLTIAGEQFFHRQLPVRSAQYGTELQLHAFFSADEFQRIWQRSLLPSVLAAGIALAAALGCAYWVGLSVSHSTQGIMSQLRGISDGDFSERKLPQRDDELREIADQINRTAETLQRYELDVRDGERMKTMVAMGAGLAHQLRNSATGCRMALDIFAEENLTVDAGADDAGTYHEALGVARRQLSLMENYLQRFLLLAKVEPNRIEHVATDLRETIQKAVTLVRHSAKHLNVEVAWNPKGEQAIVNGDQVAIEQAIVNLLLNAIEAASAVVVANSSLSNANADSVAHVRIELRKAPNRTVEIVVADNGAGPITDRDVFAPFVTDKPSGVGLGLAVVKEVAEEHEGHADWRRVEGWTEFLITLPLATEAN